MKKLFVGLLVGASAIALVGCGSGSTAKYDADYAATEEAYADYSYDDFGYEADVAMAMAEEPSEAESSSANAEKLGENVSSTRKLITTVSVDAEATDYKECVSVIKAKVDQCNGYIESESAGENYGNLTIRIPSNKLDEFMTSIYDHSNVTYYTSNVEDVTLNYVDTEARISALRTEQQRLEEFMEKAESIEDIITIEDRLSQVRYELQSYESQKRTYDNKIDYSTVNLNISEVTTYTPPVKATISARIKAGLSDNMLDLIETMGDIVVGICTVVPIIIIALLPIGILFCIIFFPINASVKKREAKRKAEAQAQADTPQEDK